MAEAFTPSIKRVEAAPKSSEAALRRGKKLLKEKRFDDALVVFEDLFRRDQADAFVHSAIARIKFKQKDLDSALMHFQAAIKKDPTKPQSYIRSARIYMIRDQLENAKEALENAIKVHPQAPVAYVGLGAIYQRQHQLELAIAQYQKALQFNPRMPPARKRLAQVLSSLGRKDEAMAQINASLRIKQDDPEAYALKGHLHLIEKQHADAQKAYERAVALDPEGKKVQFRIGLVEAYIKDDNLVQAEQVLNDLPLREQAPLLHKMWGDLYSAKGMHREALEEYRAASLAVGDATDLEGTDDIDLSLEDVDDDRWELMATAARTKADAFVEQRRHS